MAQLTLDSDLDLGTETPLILHSVSTYAPPDVKLIVEGVRLLHKGDRFTVFRGTLLPPDGSDPFDVVLKTHYGSCPDELAHEAELYETTLESLQEVSIPLYYGIFETVVHSGKLTCIVLEYCGTPVGDRLKDLSMASK